MRELDGRRALVMGLGLFGGGVGLTRYLAAHGARVTVTDLRPAAELKPSLEQIADLDVELHLGGHLEEDFRSADVVYVNPAVPKSSPYLEFARQAGVELSSEINLFLERFRGPVLGVTGSNGKTTTTEMLGAVVRAYDMRALVGGNMGVSLLDRVDDSRPEHPAVLELSSFQLEDLGLVGWSPHIAVVTNLTPNHLDRHGTFAAYIEAKSQILKHQLPRDVAVLNCGDPQVEKLAELTAGTVLRFGLEETPDCNFFLRRNPDRLALRFGPAAEDFFSLAEFGLRGEHNVANALAAAGAAYAFGIPTEVIARELARFRALPHRLELLGEVGGVEYYNDSIATTPESTIAALRSFEELLWLIAGGYDKGTSFRELGREIALRAKGCLLIGATASSIRHDVETGRERLVADGYTPRLETVEELGELEAAVEFAHARAVAGEIVVLSPACASYDQFRNFAERGDAFRRLVAKLPPPAAEKPRKGLRRKRR